MSPLNSGRLPAVLTTRFCLFIGVVLAAGATVVSGCGGSSPSSPSPTPSPASPGPDTGTPGPPATLVGAGDIGLCGSVTVAATAKLVDAISGIVFTTGDNAYPNGFGREFS